MCRTKKTSSKPDYVGLSLLVISMGALQIMLDKGEENDWFGSHFIVAFAITFVVAFVGLIVWEWFVEESADGPEAVQEQKFCRVLLSDAADRRFSECDDRTAAPVSSVAVGIYGDLSGSRAFRRRAGIAAYVPIAGQAVTHFPARNIIAFGFSFYGGLLYNGDKAKPGIKLRGVLLAARAAGVRIPLVFISVTTAAYFGMPREKNNQVAGLINFVRNIGGSILISLTNALVVERANFHQDQTFEIPDARQTVIYSSRCSL